MTVKTKFYEVDLKPVCKKCYDKCVMKKFLKLVNFFQMYSCSGTLENCAFA